MNDIALNYEEKDVIDYGGMPVKCLFYHCGAGEKPFPLHWHRRMELLHIDEGELHLTLGGHELAARAGDTVCIHSRCPHVGVAGTEGVTYRVMMFEMGLLSEELLPYLAPLRALSADTMRFRTLLHDPQVTAEVDALLGEYTAAAPSPTIMLGQLYRLIGLLAARYCDTEYERHPSNRRLWTVIDYIESHFTQSLSTGELAARFHYEESYLCRRFRQQTGLSVLAYCHALRLNRARQLLQETELSIDQIAAHCGYDSTSYFIRKFSGQFGTTPAKWRRVYVERAKSPHPSALSGGEE